MAKNDEERRVSNIEKLPALTHQFGVNRANSRAADEFIIVGHDVLASSLFQLRYTVASTNGVYLLHTAKPSAGQCQCSFDMIQPDHFVPFSSQKRERS